MPGADASQYTAMKRFSNQLVGVAKDPYYQAPISSSAANLGILKFLPSIGKSYLNNLAISLTTFRALVATFTGSGVLGFADSQIFNAQFLSPSGITADSSGILYISDTSNNRIRKIDTSCLVTTLAGSTLGFTDGTGTAAQFSNPHGIVEVSGNFYVADRLNHRIRKIDNAGVVTTLAGSGSAGTLDGTGTAAQFSNPRGITADSGNLYVADRDNHRIRKIEIATGVVTTIAGSTQGFADGTGTAAQFDQPLGITANSGNLYVADRQNHRIRKIVIATGVVTTFAGSGSAGNLDGTGTAAQFGLPEGILADSLGSLYVADTGNDRIRKIVISTGVVTTLAGSTTGFANGTGTSAKFNAPSAMTLYSDSLYVTESINNRIRKIIVSTGVVTTLAGDTGSAGFDSSLATTSLFRMPFGCAINSGNLYVTDRNNHRIRKIVISTGVVTTFAGSGDGTFADGTGTAAQFNNPQGIIEDSGNLYVADQANHRIRKIVIATGVVTTLAGSTQGNLDGTGTAAQFNSPREITADSGNLYVTDTGNNRIRKIVISTGVVTTFAGSVSGYTDATGTAAEFSSPTGITADSGNLYVADTGNQKIRKIVISTGVVTTFAGSVSGYLNGTGTAAQFTSLSSIQAYLGNLYVAESSRIRKIVIDTAVVTTFVGGGPTGADGIEFTAGLTSPSGMVNDGLGNLYFADGGSNRIRKIALFNAQVTSIAGSSSRNGYLDFTNSIASFAAIKGFTIDQQGNLYVCDFDNNNIRRITTSGIVTTFAGSGAQGSADGIGDLATFFRPHGITCDSNNLYVTEVGNHRIRKIVISSRSVTTLAGSTQGSTDGTGTSAKFNAPRGITIDSSGNLYVADSDNNKIRKIVISTGVVTTLAGTGSAGNLDGIGSSATLNNPWSVAVDSFGNLFVVDSSSSRIRKIDNTLSRNVTTFAGSISGYLDGTGTEARFSNPGEIKIDSSNFLYLVDTSNNRIRQISPSAVVTTIAGTGVAGYLDGGDVNAQFNSPVSLAIDSVGNLYIGDQNNYRIRKITYN